MSFSKMISNESCGELASCVKQVGCVSSSNFSESVNERGPPMSNMDYLLLAMWIYNPNDIDPPSWIVIPQPPKRMQPKRNRRKPSLSGAANLQSQMQSDSDHAYSVSMPAPKICCGCYKNSRYKHLYQCSYCPFAYHQGCMNPPLTKLPNGGLWMCPNHPQYLIDIVASLPVFAEGEPTAQALPVQSVMVNEDVNMGTVVMEVGTAEGCNLRLDAAQCRHVSRNHAAIYMNEATREFKLINYSEYGTVVVVNGVAYGLDVAHTRSSAAVCVARTAVNQYVTFPSEHPCRCQLQRYLPRRCVEQTNGASMLIPHGCQLEFGCQIYMFYISPV